jgi:hypothetical protein
VAKQQIDNIIKDKRIEQMMVEYNEFINDIKTINKKIL